MSLGADTASPKIYAAGALLADGTRVKEIYRDHVVLERGGQVRQINLGQQIQSATEADVAAEGHPAVAVGSFEVLTDYIRPTPVFEQGALVGYRVMQGKREEVFRQLGLRAGDIITSIDGVVVTEPREALNALRRLPEGGLLPVEIKRERLSKTLILDGSMMTQRNSEDSQS